MNLKQIVESLQLQIGILFLLLLFDLKQTIDTLQQWNFYSIIPQKLPKRNIIFYSYKYNAPFFEYHH